MPYGVGWWAQSPTLAKELSAVAISQFSRKSITFQPTDTHPRVCGQRELCVMSQNKQTKDKKLGGYKKGWVWEELEEACDLNTLYKILDQLIKKGQRKILVLCQQSHLWFCLFLKLYLVLLKSPCAHTFLRVGKNSNQTGNRGLQLLLLRLTKIATNPQSAKLPPQSSSFNLKLGHPLIKKN